MAQRDNGHYEDVGDLLAEFRGFRPGARFAPNGADPTDNDPDMLLHKKAEEYAQKAKTSTGSRSDESKPDIQKPRNVTENLKPAGFDFYLG